MASAGRVGQREQESQAEGKREETGGDTRKCWDGDTAFKIPVCVLLCIYIHTFVHMQTAGRGSAEGC